MVREFEGRTEKEAIDRAVEELRLEEGEFDVEVLEESKKSLFKKGAVRIRVHIDGKDLPADIVPPEVSGSETVVVDDAIDDDGPDPFNRVPDDETPVDINGNIARPGDNPYGDLSKESVAGIPIESSESEEKIAEFVATVVDKMGYGARVSLQKRENRKVQFNLESASSAILIGRKGKNLDALQLLANVYSGRLTDSPKVVLDTENYRARREENLKRLAVKTAEQVRRSGNSQLLEPMNPYERRLIHTTLNDVNDVTTESEGTGLYKQVRVMVKND